eukprot:m.243970 g.243970  ORF g.243970 m.243970 type:complete len:145 (-) comp29083_c0_seq1:25-459(-)
MNRLLQLFRRGPTLVGRDLAGNKYFESPAPVEGGRPKRMMETGQSEMDTAMESTVPVQWLAWLRGTRADPPTLAELEADQIRLEQLKVKVARLEAAEIQRKQALQAPQTAKREGHAINPPSPSKAGDHAATGQQFQPDAWQPGQ